MAAQRASYALDSVKPADSALATLAPPEDKNTTRDDVFAQLTARKELLADTGRLLSYKDDFAANDETTPPPDNDQSLNPAMAAVNALADSLSRSGDAPKANPHHAAPPSDNGFNSPAPNLAGAGQGPGGPSTPFAVSGGNASSSGGSGNPVGGRLAQLGNQGVFSPQLAAGPGSSATPPPTILPPSSDGPTSPPPFGGIHPLVPGAPVANNDSYTLLHDSTLSVPASDGVLVNDTDPNHLPLSAVLFSTTTHGNLSLNSDGSFTYTANAGYTGTDSFQYYATDGQANSNTATVTLTVNDPNAPATQPDSYSILHDQVLSVDAGSGVLANDSDADGDALTAALVNGSGPTHGTLQFNGDGSFAYTPNAGYVGSDSFQYTASDGVITSAATTVSLTVTDNAPVAAAHSYGIPENTTENVTAASGLLAGASDADNDPLTASLVSGSGPSHGNVTVNSDGSFTYTPNSNYTGADGFQYKVSDGALTATATATLTIHADTSSPTAGPAGYSVQHDQTLTATAAQGVLAQASDSDGDPLTASLVSGSGPSHGTLTLNADGSFTYVPTAGYTGADSFQYQASDGATKSAAATVTISVTNTGAPVANADSYSVERNNEFDADASTGVLANDTDADGDTLTASLATGPAHGTLTLSSDGSFSYVPNTNYVGTDSFTYTASDGVQTSSPATVTLTISGAAPVANNDTYQTLENHQLFLDGAPVLANDYSPDNMPLQSIQLTQPAHGTAILSTSGTITYTPNNNYVGTDSFTYDDSDGSLTSNIATITINVKASDTTPTATNLNYTLGHDTSLSTDSSSGLLSGASDSDSDTLLPVLVSGPKDGTLQLTNYGDGSFTYTPNAGFFGTDSFTFQVSDGISTSNTATVTLTVTNDAPTANPDSYSVLANSPTSVSAANGVLANDSDGEGDALTAVLVSQPTHGNVTLNSDGSFTFHPFGFTGSDSFTYEAYDGVNYSSPTTVTLTSNPVAASQSYSVTHDQTLSVDSSDGLLTGAVDADGDTMTASLATGASHGTVTVNSDGSFTYTPTAHYTGTDSFTYTVRDGTNISAPATVSLNVTDDVPTANPQSWDTPENTALSVNAATGVLASSSDEDGDSLTAQLVSGTSNGIVQLGSDGAIIYTPNTGYFGTDSFTYDVTDGISTSAPATVTLTVDEIIPDTLSNSVYSAVTTADFNNDGNPDVAVADQGLNTVSVFLDNSSGVISATPISTTTVGSAPVALAAANFGNGQQDLAVANSGSNSVSILLGNGDGTFTAGTTLTGFNDPVAVVAGNFGNGQQDLAVVNKGNNTVSILMGNGNGTFTAGTSLTTGSGPTSIAAADFNNDSKLDLVVTNSASNTVSVFLGNGNGTFQTALTDAVGTAPMSVTTADFNNDGNVDLAVSNSGSNNVSVLLGNGDGTFQAAVNYAVGSDPVAIAAGNFDGNGYLDLSVANKGDNTLSSLYNYGDGDFFAGQTYPAVSDPVSIATADFNHDGLTDQAIALADPKVIIKGGNQNQAATFNRSIGVAYSPDGKVVALAASTGDKKQYAVKLWDPSTGKLLNVLTVSAPIKAIAYSRDTTQTPQWLAIAVGGVGKLNEVEVESLTNTAKPFLVQELDLPKGQIPRSVAFSSSDVYLATGTQESHVVLWKSTKGEDGKYQYTLQHDWAQGGKDNPVTEVLFGNNSSPTDNTVLVSLSADLFDIYSNLGTEPKVASHSPTAPLSSSFSFAILSPAQTFFAVGYISSSVALYNWNGGNLIAPVGSTAAGGHDENVVSLAFPADSGKGLLKATPSGIAKLTGGRAPLQPPRPPALHVVKQITVTPSLVGMVLSPDGSIAAVALSGGIVELYNTSDLTQPTKVHTLR